MVTSSLYAQSFLQSAAKAASVVPVGSGGQGRFSSQWVIDVHLPPSGVISVLWTKLPEPPWVGWKYQFNQKGVGVPIIMGAPMPVQPLWRAMANTQPSSNPRSAFSSHSTSGGFTPGRCTLCRHQDTHTHTHTRDTNKRCLWKHYLR